MKPDRVRDTEDIGADTRSDSECGASIEYGLLMIECLVLLPMVFFPWIRVRSSVLLAYWGVVRASSRSRLTSAFVLPGNQTQRRFVMSAGNDEVEKAKEAAKEYKSSDLDGAGPPTVFDKILSGEWASKNVFEDDQCLAFRDISPQAPTHVLVIPKHRDGLTQLSKAREDQKGILGHLLYVAQKVGKEECPEGFRVVINDGEHGAQSVYHLHVHVIGGRQMEWPPG